MPACIRRRSGSIARHALFGALVAAAALGAGGASAQTLILPTIYVSYGYTCAFTVVDDANNPVTTLAPGNYEIEVSTPEPFGDIAQPANNFYGCDGAIAFQITGPNGFSWSTNLSGGDDDQVIAPLPLQPGATYTLVDNNDPADGHATFTTLASGTPVDPPTTEGTGEPSSLAPSPSHPAVSSSTLRGSLSATVSARGTVAMKFAGRRVGTLKAGRYRLTVANASRSGGFILQQLNEPYKLLVGIGALGTHTMTVTLAPGQWLFSAHFTGKKGWFNVVS